MLDENNRHTTHTERDNISSRERRTAVSTFGIIVLFSVCRLVYCYSFGVIVIVFSLSLLICRLLLGFLCPAFVYVIPHPFRFCILIFSISLPSSSSLCSTPSCCPRQSSSLVNSSRYRRNFPNSRSG